jgi:hypothetical protein
VWGVSLDGNPLNLRVSPVEAAGKLLDSSEAVMVRAVSGNQTWYFLANPQRKEITAGLPVDSPWQTDAVFSIR